MAPEVTNAMLAERIENLGRKIDARDAVCSAAHERFGTAILELTKGAIVTRAEFKPVQLIVYGAVGSALLWLLGKALAEVVTR